MPDDEPDIKNYNGISGGVANPSSASPLVYWGTTPIEEYSTSQKVGIALGVPIGPGVDKTFTSDQADGYFLSSVLTNPQLLEQYRKRFSAVGIDVSDNQKLRRAWQSAVNWASDSYVKGGRKITPWDAIDEIGASNGGAENLPEINITDTSNIAKSLTISTEQQARGALLGASQQLLGRDPTKNEVKLFTSALNALQRANPQTTRTTGRQVSQPTGSEIVQTGDGSAQLNRVSNSTTSSSVSTGGFDTDLYAFDVAKSQDDYAEYQAETTFMNALLSAIQSPVNI